MVNVLVGANALGARVTDTIKNGIIDIWRFEAEPGGLMLAMTCAEIGSGFWLMPATRLGLPVSTTRTIVGVLVGVGFGSQSPVKFAWNSGSVSQVAASWGTAPIVAVLERKDLLEWGVRMIPLYLAFTGSMLSLFIVVEAPSAPSLEEFGAGKATVILLATFFGVLAIACVFVRPIFRAQDTKKGCPACDNRFEHLWTYPQVASAMLMSIAHGSNDVTNAVGPWSAAYSAYLEGQVATEAPTPISMLIVAGFLLGLGFWVFKYHIIRSLGDKITQLSPTRGFSMELGSAIMVLLASRLGLPVSIIQCLTSSTVGVALMDYDIRAVKWKQIVFIFSG